MLEIGLVEIRAAQGIVDAGVALDAEARILEVHRARDRHVAGLFIVGDRVRRDGALVLMELHVAGKHREAVGIERCAVAVDADRDDRRREIAAGAGACAWAGRGTCRRRGPRRLPEGRKRRPMRLELEKPWAKSDRLSRYT